MPRKSAYSSRRAWEDRYRTPSIPQLLAGIDPSHAELFSHLRAALSTIPGLRERLAWHGIPWRWCLCYTPAAAQRPIAYLVPQPSKPLLILPLSEELVTEIIEQKSPRSIRDGVALTPSVGGIRWTQWELASRALAEELLHLARRSAEHAGLPHTAQMV